MKVFEAVYFCFAIIPKFIRGSTFLSGTIAASHKNPSKKENLTLDTTSVRQGVVRHAIATRFSVE
jgi:hypothetical protein